MGFDFRSEAVITVSLEPTPQTTSVGGQASVDLIISGLGDLASPSLGGFDIDLSYDASVVSAGSASFGSLLDLGTLGSAQLSDLATAGLIHLDEVSFETADDLNAAQPDTFTLATLGFTGLAAGSSPLIFGSVQLSDENGRSISEFNIDTGLIQVGGGNNVPDTGSTGLLFLGGMVGLWQAHRRSAAGR